jgi:hypothetical protein
MWFPSLLLRRRAARPTRPAGRTAPRVRPNLEALEERAVPAFLAPVNNPGASGPTLVGDFNNDHVPDLVTATSDFTTRASTVHVRLGNGNGTFQAPPTSPASLASTSPLAVVPLPVAVGDFNRDANLDLLMSDSVLLGNGDGTFAPPQALPPPITSLAFGGKAVAAADLNGDGNLDVVGSHQAAAGFTTFSAFNHTDLIPTYITEVDVYLGKGDGSFLPPTSTALGNSTSIFATSVGSAGFAVGDFTGDGKLDVLGAGLGNLGLLEGDGAGGFTGPGVTISGFDPNVVGSPRSGIQVGDFDGDGKLDFLIGNPSNGSVSIFLNQGSGAFSAPRTFGVGAPYSARGVGDFNHDGKLDAVAVGGNISVLLGNGDGTLQQAQPFAGAPNASLAAVADLDGDGFPDLVLRDGGGLSVLLNDQNWPPVLLISDVTRPEGKKGQTVFTFTVTLSSASDVPVTVNYSTADGRATVADNDYVAATGTLTFAPGQTSKTITVLVNGDRKKEADETFFVNLSGAVNARLVKSQGVGSLLNDDG